MAKHILFLVHGMGDTQPGWSQAIQQAIRTSYASYPGLSLLVPFDTTFSFCEINYNDKFDARRQAWAQNAQTVLSALAQSGLDAPAVKLLTTYSAETGKENFLATHVLDVLLYRFIPQIAEQIRTSVQKQILQTLAAQPENETINWSIIAHSLGTAVTHDTLHAMYSGGGLPPSVTRPKLIAMIANVSRVLETGADVYTSKVHACIDPTKGICDYFLNARHEWDPIPVPKQFKPVDDWPDLATRREQRFQNLAINAIEAKNVHDFAHYLKNPKVHIALFRALTWNNLIDEASAAGAIAQYEAGTPLAQFQNLTTKLKQLWPNEQASWKEIITCFRKFQELVKSDI